MILSKNIHSYAGLLRVTTKDMDC